MKHETNVAFARNLAQLMRAKGLRNSDLARGADLSHTAIANYKQGRLPKLDALHRLAEFFDVPLDDLLHGTEAGAALRIAAAAADPKTGKRGREEQPERPAVNAKDLLAWQQRALAAEEKLESVQAALAALMRQLAASDGRRRTKNPGAR